TRAGTTKVVEAQEGLHRVTVVWLHRLGDTGDGVAEWMDEVWNVDCGFFLLDLPHVKWIFPSAPTAPVTVNRGHRAPSWYDVCSFNTDGFNADFPVDARGLDEAARYIAGILEEERRANPVARGLDEAARYIAGILEEEKKANPDVTYIVGGISQGGGLSLYLMCRKALGSFADGSDASALPFSASIGLSTWLPQCSLVPGPGGADGAVAKRAARHPLFMTLGEADPLVGYDLLRDAGFSNLTFKTYPNLGHGMSREELADMRAWLLELAPL
ncbi:unnamed protein product, partial [Closterium sp. Naga37s-1]